MPVSPETVDAIRAAAFEALSLHERLKALQVPLIQRYDYGDPEQRIAIADHLKAVDGVKRAVRYLNRMARENPTRF